MQVYVVLRNIDTTEGRGPFVFDAVFTAREVATRYADACLQNYGQPGTSNGWASVIEATLWETLPDERQLRQEELRRSALAKLTAEEREALGLA